jgi:hypothetical protein
VRVDGWRGSSRGGADRSLGVVWALSRMIKRRFHFSSERLGLLSVCFVCYNSSVYPETKVFRYSLFSNKYFVPKTIC